MGLPHWHYGKSVCQSDQGLIPGRVIPKIQKMVLDASLLNSQHHKAWIKDEWINPGKEVMPSSTPWCHSY